MVGGRGGRKFYHPLLSPGAWRDDDLGRFSPAIGSPNLYSQLSLRRTPSGPAMNFRLKEVSGLYYRGSRLACVAGAWKKETNKHRTDARERETREGEVPPPLACLPLARTFFFAPTTSKRRVLRILGRDKAGHQ